jgi:hypothetical protein
MKDIVLFSHEQNINELKEQAVYDKCKESVVYVGRDMPDMGQFLMYPSLSLPLLPHINTLCAKGVHSNDN